MIEKTILDYLESELPVRAFMEEPKDPPDEYVRIEKQGAACVDHVKSAVFAVQSYSTSLYGAAVISECVVEAMLDSVKLKEIAKCSLNSEYNFTDEETHRYRYQAVFDIVYF